MFLQDNSYPLVARNSWQTGVKFGSDNIEFNIRIIMCYSCKAMFPGVCSQNARPKLLFLYSCCYLFILNGDIYF